MMAKTKLCRACQCPIERGPRQYCSPECRDLWTYERHQRALAIRAGRNRDRIRSGIPVLGTKIIVCGGCGQGFQHSAGPGGNPKWCRECRQEAHRAAGREHYRRTMTDPERKAAYKAADKAKYQRRKAAGKPLSGHPHGPCAGGCGKLVEVAVPSKAHPSLPEGQAMCRECRKADTIRRNTRPCRECGTEFVASGSQVTRCPEHRQVKKWDNKADSRDNVQLMHLSCNIRKSDKGGGPTARVCKPKAPALRPAYPPEFVGHETGCAICGSEVVYAGRGRPRKTCSTECAAEYGRKAYRRTKARYHQAHRDKHLAYMKAWNDAARAKGRER